MAAFGVRGRETTDATFSIELAARALCADEFFMNCPQGFMSIHREKESVAQTRVDGLR